MFYNFELLCAQNQGNLAIAWIMATRGPKKLKNKQICEVKVDELSKRIFDLITTKTNRPTNRLSLRLSANLLFGTIQIYRHQVQDLLEKVVLIYPTISKMKTIFIDETAPRRRRLLTVSEIHEAPPVESIELPIITDKQLATSLSVLQIDPTLITLRDAIGNRSFFEEESFGTAEEPFVVSAHEKVPDILSKIPMKRPAPPPDEVHVVKPKQPRKEVIEIRAVEEPLVLAEEQPVVQIIEQPAVPSIRDERRTVTIPAVPVRKLPKKQSTKSFFIYIQASRKKKALTVNFSDLARHLSLKEDQIDLNFEDPAMHFNDEKLVLIFNEEEEISALRQATSASAFGGSIPSFGRTESVSSKHIQTPQFQTSRAQLKDDLAKEIESPIRTAAVETLTIPEQVPQLPVIEEPSLSILQETIEKEVAAAGFRNGPPRFQTVKQISMTKNDENFILRAINNWNYKENILTIEDVCLKPINRLNISKTFGFLLNLAKNDIVTLHHEPDSLKLAHITKGKN